METTQRGKKKVNKRNNVEKFSESIGNIKDKMKSEKQSPIPGVEVVKSEPSLDVEFKKEPGLNSGLCDSDSKSGSICPKGSDGKTLKSGMMETPNMVKVQPDRNFMDSKPEIISRSEDNTEEDDLQSNLLPSKIKSEAPGPDGNMFPPESNENLILGLCSQSGSTPNPGGNLEQPGSGIQSGVQPLPSNVINKQPGTMEAQYMQQQSQIFVFTTALANKSAEAVLQGQYPSIIAYHCAQPGTKKYLEKHPLKLNQFNRQSPAQWLNNLAQIKQKTAFGAGSNMKGIPMGTRGLSGGITGPCEMGGPGSGPGPGPGPGPGTGPGPGPGMGPAIGPGPRPMAPNIQGTMTELDGMGETNDSTGPSREMGDHRQGEFPPGGVNQLNSISIWNQGNMNQNNLGFSGQMKNLDRDKQCPLNRPPLVDNMNPNHFPGVSQLTLTGTKVPTENLTPQQRQHRAEQLATLRKMHEMLFPENQSQPTDEFGNPRMLQGGNMNVPQNPEDPNRNNVLDTPELKNQIGIKNMNNSNNPMNRNMGRNMNGQANRNVQMEGPLNHNMVNPNNNILDTPENLDNSMQDQNSQMMQKLQGSNNFPSMAAQLEWQKHYQQFQEEQKKKKGSRTDSPAPRNCNKMQGPPPPYHQTARCASVPIAVPSPNPGSPNNTTSNLSLPSPRSSSDLNSPSDINKHSTPGSNLKMSTCSPPNNQGSPSCSKLIVSNPETPVSVSASQSPTPSTRKESSQPGLEFPNKDVFSRTVSSLSQQKHKPQPPSSNKEPNLMPVPSPQQIQYLNTFEGQELTIQKQPNTSLKETSMNSPMSHQTLSETPKCKTPNGAANSPLPQVTETSPRFSNVVTSSTTCTTPVSTQSQTTVPASKDSTTVPSSPDASGPSPCRSENLPLNPNGINCPPNNKSMHFDPITSLAQMSQQLTSQTTPPCPGTGPIMSYNSSSMHMVGNIGHIDSHVGPGGPVGPMGHDNQGIENMQFPPTNPGISCSGPMMDMSPGFLSTSSPKPNMGNPPTRCVGPFFGGPGFQRMMGPNSYNGMNVQVKANTPNTIQYLPARPNTNSPNPNSRGPPSLDFLQRFTNPLNNIDSKVPFIPNCHSNSMEGVNPSGNTGMNCGPIGGSGGTIMSNPVPNMLLGGNMVLNPGPVGPLRGQLRPGPGGMMKVPPMGGGNAGYPPGPGCDPMSMGPGGNANMFCASKSSPLGMPPDASQPLPPSMSQGNNFKNSPFVGPTMSDPNYAQQFHNFQQQLYATNTRSHQLHSEYRSTYRWHEYTGPRQEVIRKPPQNSGTGHINEPPLPRRRKHPELAYRAHDILAAIDKKSNISLDKSFVLDRARSEERWGGSRHRSSRRSKSEGPPNDQSYRFIYTKPTNSLSRFQKGSSYVNDENVAPPNTGDGDVKDGTSPGRAPAVKPNKPSEYNLQFAWPAASRVVSSRIEDINSQHVPRKSISMNALKSKGTPVQETVPVHKKISALKNQSDLGVLRSIKPNPNAENTNPEDTKNEDTDWNEFKSEYKKNFQPFSKYNFDENKGVFEERPNTMDSLRSNVNELESPSSWYKEVVLLRKKANQYRHRGWGTELVSDHIAQLYNDQITVWEQVSKRSSLSALALASTIVNKDRSSRPVTKEEKEKENRKNSPTKSLIRVRSARAGHDSSADRASRDTIEKKNVKNKMVKKQVELSPTKGNTRSKKTSVERISPKHISRISASSAPPNTHKASNQGSEKPKRRPRPTSLVSSVPSGSKISFAQMKQKDGTGDLVLNTMPDKNIKLEILDTIIKDEISGEDMSEFPVVIDEQIVKSPPEPTRVKSPEQIVMRSPEPVNWTVPLDTGKTFTVTQNVREGDVGPRSFSEARAWTPSSVPPPASVSAPTQLLELGKVNISG